MTSSAVRAEVYFQILSRLRVAIFYYSFFSSPNSCCNIFTPSTKKMTRTRHYCEGMETTPSNPAFKLYLYSGIPAIH
ncbi:hypothetical protein A3J36_00690 [Candidatus Uhrbacteria bacterium RIFCSPLOWO2_02_FULL_54_37]|uniref:Uncharacterized protein n=2 Tax=Candidatus Uhriibacteriota TaxID=1752732 RepID=A0A1F7VIC9_9BACT|nr:MAG: hypothetical protein A3B36_00950 [Candidatus Uhrbacteria bacterium RIFCSPLOWO2_01_FULL_55_36]OGL89928.1 MAG: hypothetical protein A3J36_00690 [Candidatus Uhrbacteria bacterium RIFCSPLOWO2_02_FULL_54_37]